MTISALLILVALIIAIVGLAQTNWRLVAAAALLLIAAAVLNGNVRLT